VIGSVTAGVTAYADRNPAFPAALPRVDRVAAECREKSILDNGSAFAAPAIEEVVWSFEWLALCC